MTFHGQLEKTLTGRSLSEEKDPRAEYRRDDVDQTSVYSLS